MAMGSILFAALAVEVGLGMLDREINLPLRRLAGEAGKLTANGAPLAIHIAGPRRPSVYFYLPDRIFGQPMVERGEIEPLREFLRERRPAYVLADKERAERLMAAAPDLHVRGHSGKWVLLHAAAAASTRHPLVSPPSP